MELPTIKVYGEYKSGNYGAHALRVDVGLLTVWYSYHTPIAFRSPGGPRVVHVNDWGPTTGRHLNDIDGGDKAAKAARVSAAEFARCWDLWAAPALESV